MDNFHIRPLSESDIDAIIRDAGGDRAHLDADQRKMPGSDYVLLEAVLELKSLDEEGFEKPERQAKLATLFRKHEQERPVIVLDRAKLPLDSLRQYDRIIEGPIKTAIAKARKQLRQSRSENQSVEVCILFIVNNGYTALEHDKLVQLVAHRARNDSTEIDGVVVAGCYFYSDSFDSYFLWPIEYVPINLDRPFTSFDQLKDAWDRFAESFMTSVVLGKMPPDSLKGPVIDTKFEVDGVRFVKPAPPMGLPSGFFQNGRPRHNSTGITCCPPVAICFPELNLVEWTRFHGALDNRFPPFDNYQSWQAERVAAESSGQPLKPFVPIIVTFKEWEDWCNEENAGKSNSSIFEFATVVFQKKIQLMIASAREYSTSAITPSRYVLAITEEIGQDRANDISHILMVREVPFSDRIVHEVVVNAPIFHEYAVALASAYALAEGIEFVLWQKDLTYAWV